MTNPNDPKLHLQSVAQSTYECLRCAFCFDLSWLGPVNLCPSYTWGAFESYGARGRIAVARAVLEGELAYDESMIQSVFACTECRACAEHCFKYIDTNKVYAAIREDMADRGLLPPQLANATNQTVQFHNPYGEKQIDRHAWLKNRERVDKPARLALFAGCTPAYVRRSMASDAYTALEAAGLDFALLSDEWCCGHPFLAAGQRERAAGVMRHNVDAFKRLGVERVVFDCPGCMRAFSEEVPEVLGEPLPFQAVHISQILAEQLRQGRIRFGVFQSGIVVTYHDPCSLGRGLGVYDAPRELIAAMPGMRLAEMPRHGRDSYCCGAGSFVRYDYPGLVDKTGSERFREIESTGAQLVLTACPACLTQFQQVRVKSGSKVQVMDLVSLFNRVVHWK